MALRTLLGAAAVVLCVTAGCKDKGDSAKATGLGARCEQLAKTCGDNDKHVAKIVEGCRQVAAAQTQKGCEDKISAVYDCYEKTICGKDDKVWAFEDLGVLADRKTACAAERTAADACMKK